MANNNNISNFSAADIQKYHSGELSPKEMNAMEKAALDDPFLADALEGYHAAGATVHSDLADLHDRLQKKTTTSAPVISLNSPEYAPKTKAVSWLRIAAMIVVIVGAGLLANQFIFNKTPGEIADNNIDNVRKEVIGSPDSIPANVPPVVVPDNSSDATSESAMNPPPPKGNKTTTTNNENEVPVQATPVTAVPGINEVTRIENKKVESDGPVTRSQIKKPAQPAMKEGNAEDQVSRNNQETLAKADIEKAKTREIANREAANQYRNTANTFRGRVTDNSRAGVPFANVTNVDDNVGTYTDANGYFNLTSPDSILQVQVRSIGFENTVIQLRNDVPANEVVLLDDHKDLTAVVLQKQKPNAASRAQNRGMVMEESEPADGWDNYDSYLANNLKPPEEFKTTQKSMGSVELSFELDKNGEPARFKIEKSLCSSCDKEAIRLVKEGPKWKKNAGKGRTRVTINF